MASRLLLSPKYLWLLAGLLLVPALLIHLGLMTLIGDEGIRADVALEMLLSGNYLVPTINGEPYLNKPPLYNWILAGAFTLLGRADEWAARLPTVFFLLTWAGVCVWYLRKHVPAVQAWLVAAMIVTCGRILFWDSLLGLIDICFSLVVFSNFLWIFHWSERERWGRMFVGSWLITVVAFMLKGLPALVFQVLTIAGWLAWLGWERHRQVGRAARWALVRGLAWPNWVGMALAFGLLGSYYYLYAQQAPLAPLLERLFTESAKRTAVQYGMGKTILHLFTFPFEMAYHFFPWSLMVLLVFARGAFRQIWQHRLLTFFAVTFAANIWVYWSSVEVYPRYLLMFLPLVFLPFVHWYLQPPLRQSPFGKWVNGLFVAFALLATVGALAPLFLQERLAQVPALVPKSVLLFALAGWMLLHIWRQAPARQLPAMVVLLLVVRLGFDWFVLPDRLREDWGTLVRATTVETAQKARAEGQRLWLYKGTWIPATNTFYLSAHTGQIIRRTLQPSSADWMIVDTTLYRVPLQVKSTFKIRHGQRTMLVGPLQPADAIQNK